MAARRHHRPSALREISKKLIDDDDNSEDDASASASPSDWIRQIQRAQQMNRIGSIHPEDQEGSHEFQFRSERVLQEVVDENEESELESEYIDVSESEEEEVITKVPVEREIECYETESASGYTSGTPSHSASPHYTVSGRGVVSSKEPAAKRPAHRQHQKPPQKPRARRQSVPVIGHRGSPSQPILPKDPHRGNLHHLHQQRRRQHRNPSIGSEGERRSPNAENHPPPPLTPSMQKRLGAVSEEQKDPEQEASPSPPALPPHHANNGSFNGDALDRSVLNSHIEEHLLSTNKIDKAKRAKLSILPQQKLEFDVESPAPPSILTKNSAALQGPETSPIPKGPSPKRKMSSSPAVSPLAPCRPLQETPHFSNIHKRLNSVLRMKPKGDDTLSGDDNMGGDGGDGGDAVDRDQGDSMGMSVDGDDAEDGDHDGNAVDDEVSPIGGDGREQSQGSLARIHLVHTMGTTTGGICNALEDNMKALRATFPSPAIASNQHHDDEDGDHRMGGGDAGGHTEHSPPRQHTADPLHAHSPRNGRRPRDCDKPSDRRKTRSRSRGKNVAESVEDDPIGSRSASRSPPPSNSPPKRRRSARIAKKQKSALSEEEEVDLSNIDTRSRRGKSKRGARSKSKAKAKASSKAANASPERTAPPPPPELPPFIEDSDDGVMGDDPPLPSTKVRGKKVASRTRDRDSGRRHEEGVVSAVRRTTRHSVASAQSNRSMASNISGISGVSSIASNRSRTKTLRSRKEDLITSPFSDHDDDDEEGGTFDTPRGPQQRLPQRNKARRAKRDALSAKPSPKRNSQRRSKSPRVERAAARNHSKSKEESSLVFDGDDTAMAGHDADGLGMEMEPFGDDQFGGGAEDALEDDTRLAAEHRQSSPNVNEVAEEKLEIESGRSDDERPAAEKKRSRKKKSGGGGGSSRGTSRSHPTRSRKGDKSGSNTKRKKKGQKKAKTEKEKKRKSKKNKSRRNRKRKASDTDLSDSPEPERKRPRLSQYVVKPSSVEPAENLRRSKRVRFKPLAFWANERIAPQQEMLTYDSVRDKFESGAKEDIILGQNDQLTHFQSRLQKTSSKRRSKKTSKSSRSKKKTKGKEKKKKSRRKRKGSDGKEENDEERSVEPMSDDEGEPAADPRPFDGTAWIYDSVLDEMVQKCVAKTRRCVNLVELAFRGEDEDDDGGRNHNNNTNSDSGRSRKKGSTAANRVRGAKGLEEDSFSCGILEIPPNSEKLPEISFFTEQFFVHKCEAKMLRFKLGDDEFLLSRGSMFFVPPENEYSLHNLSKTHPVQLIFTLIKTNGGAEEEQTQMSQTQLTGHGPSR